MKKILILVLLLLFCSSSALGGEFEDNTLKKAEQGYAVAQYGLGLMYYFGKGVPQDYKQAADWYTKAAEQGHASAQYALGVMHKNGQGVPQDYKQAVYWFTKAAEQGDDRAQHNLGFMYGNGQGVTQDYKQAADWYTTAAEQGEANAQLNLGVMYDNGQGVPQDYKQAVYWYTKAAEQGHVKAQFNLGVMYKIGKGVPQDYKQAADWYTKAAEQGDADAQLNLGLMYVKGQGVPQNYKLTYVWSSLAAAQGGENAIHNRDITVKKLTPQQLAEAQDIAAKIQYQIDHPTETKEQQSSIGNIERKANGSGTGFIITKDGYILTCHHVIKDANEIKIAIEGNTYQAKLISDDPNNDLALLKINGSFPAIAFSSNRSAKMGQEVFTIGYPNPSLQGVNAKITKGIVNSLTGFQDDLRLYQISVPVQPGNSGGALVDENGNVLGVIVAMLDAKTTFKISGSLPQNVNYAVKSLYAQAMIDTMPEVAEKLISPSRGKSDAIDNAQKSTVMVLSYR